MREAPEAVRAGCAGVPPLEARLEDWMSALAADPGGLARLLAQHGSPLNLHELSPFARNAEEIRAAGEGLGVEPEIFFARKANKCLAFVEEAGRLGLGVDVAGERELRQTLEAGVDPARIVLTAAVKGESLLRLCADSGATVAIDNRDELELLDRLTADRRGAAMPLALRLTPGRLDPSRPTSRFGLPASEALDAARLVARRPALRLDGVHFHLDGYSADERARTIGEAFELVDALREAGHQPRFLDIGGGFPISYLREREQWDRFWREQRRAVRGDRRPLTFAGHGLGLRCSAGRVEGEPALYPYWQEPVRGDWLREILTATTRIGSRGQRVADALGGRGLELRCEPGRALLDGCGMTAVSVEFTKPYEGEDRLVGLAMNRTQCRTSSEDFLVDPLLVREPGEPSPSEPSPGFDGYLVGAYCIERELLSWRRLRFGAGVRRGDMVLFPNTAGYLMHILESSSHQMPLARNLILDPGAPPLARLDRIDEEPGR